MTAYKQIAIDPQSGSYRILVDEIVGLFRAGRVVPFLGAGFSSTAPSCMPLGCKCIAPLVTILEEKLDRWLTSPVLVGKRAVLMKGIRDAPLESLIEVYRQSYGHKSLDYLDVFDSTDEPNVNHDALAVLAASGFLINIVTMNFDVLIERAMATRGVNYWTEIPLNDYCFGVPSTKSGGMTVKILKPHGSITDPIASGNRVCHIVTALGELGERPQQANIKALRRVLCPHTVLLIAGYNSAADWDVFPIIARIATRFDRVYWCRFSPAEIFSQEVEDFLTTLGPNRACIVDGDVSILLQSCLSRLGLVPMDKPVVERIHNMTQRANALFSNSKLNDYALACLMQRRSHFEISRSIHENLLHDAAFEHGHPDVYARVLLSHGFANHLPRRSRESLHLTERAVQAFAQLGEDFRNEHANAMVWLAYEYLCTLKPDRLFIALFRPWEFISSLICSHKKARHCVHLAIRRATPANRRQIVSLSRYYFTDLAHCWANITMLPMPCFKWFRRWSHRRVLHGYVSIRRKHADYMRHGYYWLRELECRLIGGCLRTVSGCRLRQISYIISAWDRSYTRTGNVVEGANAKVYMALLEYYSSKANRTIITTLLDEAEEMWSAPKTPSRSGLLRVILFRCHTGCIGLPKAMTQLLFLTIGGYAIRPKEIKV